MDSCNTNSVAAPSGKLERRLQSITVVLVVYTLVFGFFFSCYLTIHLVLFSSRWMKFLFAIYLVYFYYDRDAHRRCGRSGKFAQKARKWGIWKHFTNYFPVKLIKTADLDPSSNYIFCAFPHGLFAFGIGSSFSLDSNGCDDMFPGLEFRILSLNLFFLLPFFRELTLAFGGCSCSKESMEYLLSTKPRTQKQSRALVLLVGGAEDAMKTRPGVYRIVLKNRKGFVRVALKTGTPLVPVFSFGEVDYYNVLFPAKGSYFEKMKQYLIETFGVSIVKVVDGNWLTNFFSMKPKRTPIHVVVGSPIKLPKIENPIEEEVNKYHKIFIEKLIELFDSHKNTFSQLYNYENITLELV